MAGIRTESGKWVTCTEEEAKEYAEYLTKRYSRMHKVKREQMIREHIVLRKEDEDGSHRQDNRGKRRLQDG